MTASSVAGSSGCFRRVAAAACVLGSLAGCQSLQSSDSRLLGLITPYRLEVVQGNVITKEQADLVKPGMSRAEVRDVLGSPLLTDIFHVDRWDYVFSLRRQGTAPQSRAVVVLFDGDIMKSMEASGELPAEREFVASIDTQRSRREARTLRLSDEQRQRLAAPQVASPVESVPDVAARSYPPLEPSLP